MFNLKRLPPLHRACLKNDHAKIREILAGRVDLGERDYLGRLALHCAAANASASIVLALLTAGISPEAKDGEFGDTPLHYACHTGNLPAAELLLRRAVNTNAPCGQYATTPLQAVSALPLGNRPLLARLIESGADPLRLDNRARNALHYAADTGDAPTVTYLLTLHLNPDAQDTLGFTPLHLAANRAPFQREAAVCLLTAGADATLRARDAKSAAQRLLGIDPSLAPELAASRLRHTLAKRRARPAPPLAAS